MAFGLIGVTLAKRWDDKLLRLDSPELWSLVGMAIVTSVLVVIGLRFTGKALLLCPHCKKYLGGISSQVTVGSGRCGHCGEVIIDEN